MRVRVALAGLIAATLVPLWQSPAGAASTPTDCPAGTLPALATSTPSSGDVAAGEVDCYVLELTEAPESLSIVLDGPAGTTADLDLYVKYGAPPTSETYDCKAFRSSSDEECHFTSPKNGDWYAMVFGAGTGGAYALSAKVGGCSDLPIGGSSPGRVDEGEANCYRITVPSGLETLRVSLHATGAGSDADLYLSVGKRIESFFDPIVCFSASFGNEEGCLQPRPEAAVWFATVDGFKGTADYVVEASSTACQSLEDAVPASRDGEDQRIDCFRFDVAGEDVLKASITGTAGTDNDLELYRGGDAEPVCVPFTTGTDERCSVSGPQDGAWYAVVRTLDAPATGSYQVVMEAFDAEPLAAQSLVSVALDGEGDIALYRLPGPTRAQAALAGLEPSTDFDLFTRRGAPPRLHAGEYECAGQSGTSLETCAQGPGDGDLYILILSFAGAGSAMLEASTLV